MRPMLAVPAPQPGRVPAGEGWLHEVKWDGIRALADLRDGRLALTNRNEVDVTVAYPELLAEAEGLPADVLLDGEIVALDEGKPSFPRIAGRMHLRDAGRAARAARALPVTYMVFDLLRIDGVATLGLPLSERRAMLEGLGLPVDRAGASGGRHWQVPPVYDDGAALSSATAAQGLEGVVSKRRASPYQPGVRSPDWVKVPHRAEVVAVIGGWVAETTSPGRLGALWVGHPADEATFDADGLLYPIARVGSGLQAKERDALMQVLRQIERPTCPFDPPPSGVEARRTTWVEPVLCVQIRYLEITPAKALRQPVLRALRPDVTPLAAPTAPLLGLDS